MRSDRQTPIRVLVVSTNGIMRDGITEWMVQCFSHMDLSSFEVDVAVWKGTPRELVDRVSSAGLHPQMVSPRKENVLKYAKDLVGLMHSREYEIVHICGNSATVAIELCLAKLSGVQVRLVHSHNTTCSHKGVDRALRPIMHAFSTGYLACGNAAGEWLFGNRRFTVIPNGKEIHDYCFDETDRQTARVELGLSDNDIAFGHVGLLNEQKNHSFLLDVFSSLRKSCPSSRLFLMGEGPLRKELSAKSERLGISDSVSFLGFRPDAARLLNAMDCMLFPSLYEGLPNVVIEWQLNGLPAIISDTITEECCFTDYVVQLPIDDSVDEWVRAAIQAPGDLAVRAARSKTASQIVLSLGYDAGSSSAKLRQVYVRSMGKDCLDHLDRDCNTPDRTRNNL